MRNPQLQVSVNVYDLAESNMMLPCCGAHHTGVEIMGREYSFAKGEGVYDCRPRDAPDARFKMSLDMGRTSLSMRQIEAALDKLRDEYRGESYHIVKKNCNHFSDALCRAIVSRPLPPWVNRLAWWGSWCACCISDYDDEATHNAGAGSSGQPLLPVRPPMQQLFTGQGHALGGTQESTLGRLMSFFPRRTGYSEGQLTTDGSGSSRELRLQAIEMRHTSGQEGGIRGNVTIIALKWDQVDALSLIRRMDTIMNSDGHTTPPSHHHHRNQQGSKSSLGDVKAGTKVWVFYQMQKGPRDPAWFAVDTHVQGYNRPQIGWSDRWQPAVVIQDFKEADFNPAKHDTYVKVRYEHRIWFDREQDVLNTTDTRNIEQAYYPGDVRLTSPPTPSLSIFVVRWGNPNFGIVNDYDWESWGEAGSNVSDTYICHMMQKGIRKVARNDYEVLSAFVTNADDLRKISPLAIRQMLTGRHKAAMYFLWPTAFEDNISDAGGYIDKDAFFELMVGIEAMGVPTMFPHPSHLLDTIVSKAFYAHLCTIPDLHLPPTTRVSRGHVVASPDSAARLTWERLSALCDMTSGGAQKSNPLPRGAIAKLGYSWEAADVRTCDNIGELSYQMLDLFEQKGCKVDSVFVQQRVPVDLELRMFVVNGKVERILYTRFRAVNSAGLFIDFEHETKTVEAAKKWFRGDVPRMQEVERICFHIIDQFYKWMDTESVYGSPANRFDFLVGYDRDDGVSGPSVYLGEVGELGFSMVDFPEGPRKVFKEVGIRCLKTTQECSDESCCCRPFSNWSPKRKRNEE